MDSRTHHRLQGDREAVLGAVPDHRLLWLLDTVPDAVCFKDGGGHWRLCNNTLLDLLQLPHDGYHGKTGKELQVMVPAHARELLRALERGDEEAWRREGPSRKRVRVRRPGGPLALEVTRHPTWGMDGERRELVVIARDVTAEQGRQGELLGFAKGCELADAAVFVTSPGLQVRHVNPAFEERTGYPEAEIRGRDAAKLLSKGYEAWFLQYVREQLRSHGEWEGDLWCRRKDGSVFPAWARLQAVKDDETGRFVGYAGVLDEGSAADGAVPASRRKDNYDPLTALPNRSLFHERLGQEVVRARRNGTRLALLFVDLDFFKEVNDTLGHQAGDSLLREAARRVRESVREADTVSRLGGDEFTVLLPDLGEPGHAGPVAKGIVEALSRPFELEDTELAIGASVGIAVLPDDAAGIESLLRAADLAMYQAKHAGRGRYAFFEERLNIQAQRRAGLGKAMGAALEKDQFVIHYQPQFDVDTGQIAGLEVFLRWQHPEQGLLDPDQFLGVAEETGLIDRLGDWLFRSVARDLREWAVQGVEPGVVTVNVCARQVRDRSLAERVRATLQANGVPPERIQFDLTEAIFMKEIPNISESLERLRALGVHLGIDDFGTTGGRLERVLTAESIDTIKVDRRFIQEITDPARGTSMANGIIALGEATGKRVIATGVERREQVDHLVSRGCRYMQGNYLSPALPRERCAELLSGWAHQP